MNNANQFFAFSSLLLLVGTEIDGPVVADADALYIAQHGDLDVVWDSMIPTVEADNGLNRLLADEADADFCGGSHCENHSCPIC